MSIRFGVIGAGRIGKVHARTIASNPKAKLAYIADAVPQAAQALAAEHGAQVATVDDIMKAKDVDAVLIGSPTGFHAEQIQAAAKAGKAIMCEKPVSLSVELIEATLKVVEAHKAKSSAKAGKRWSDECQWCRRLLLGDRFAYGNHRGTPAGWKPSGCRQVLDHAQPEAARSQGN